MLNTILGLKRSMGQVFVQGRRMPVTRISAGPCVVTQIKTEKKDGYWAVQFGYGEKNIKNIKKPLQGHLKKVIKGKKAPYFLAEARFDKEPKNKNGEIFKIGDVVKASDLFKKGDVISVSAISKGKGFAGVVKRWHFAGGPRTHGQSDRQRSPGSISGGTTPGRVRKGKKMAGRMGGEKTTVKNLQVFSVDLENDQLEVLGPIPGSTGSRVVVEKIGSGKLEGISEIQVQVVEGEEKDGEGVGKENPETSAGQDVKEEETKDVSPQGKEGEEKNA